MVAKKQTKKPAAAKSNSARANKPSASKPSGAEPNMLVTLTLVLVVVQLIILLGVLISFESKFSDSNDKITAIESKVNAIDNFFAENVQGYDSAPTIVAEDSMDDGGDNMGDTVDVDVEGDPFLGAEDAPVTVIEYSDYECPFCGRFFTQSYPQLKEEYIETGKVKFVFKDFPLSFHQNAMPAAIAANCVQRELGNDKYFEYHDVLFENQRSLTASNLKQWALEVGATEEAYDACIVDPDVEAEAQADLAEGSSVGVTGTPSFLINGNLVVGAQPYEVIKQAIEDALNN